MFINNTLLYDFNHGAGFVRLVFVYHAFISVCYLIKVPSIVFLLSDQLNIIITEMIIGISVSLVDLWYEQ